MKLEKNITFIYMDSAEKAMFTPVYEEAKKRGYEVKMTTNKFEKCEIGFYCQHINFPRGSKFSVIMLHDIIQQYSNWPDIWFLEPWNKYDIGILPSEQWVENWNKSSQWYYARPKIGMYKIGWTKADSIKKYIDCKEISDENEISYREEFYSKYNLDLSKKTILYAPAWENDGKQDDFVKSMLKLDVNIIIKQCDFDEKEYPEIVKNIRDMKELHKNIKNVRILPPQTNIFEAISVSDILVSEESSTMAEAVMMGVPAVSVSNWFIPDVTPSRYPKCNYDFVTITTKEKLTDCIADMIDNYEIYKRKTVELSNKNFSNLGKSSAMVMDIIDDYLEGRKIRYKALEPQNNKTVPIKRKVKHKYIYVKRRLYTGYIRRCRILNILWKMASVVKGRMKTKL